MKKKVFKAHAFSLPYFTKVFEVKCDAFNMARGVVLSQEGKPIAFSSEKLN